MDTDRHEHQIIRKDARACFVETLNDSFEFGKVHFSFATYDMKLPAGQRQTNSVHIYMAVDEFLELCRKLCSGELRYMMQQRLKESNKEPLYKCLGGTSAEKLAKINRSRPDGMSLSRTAELVCGKNGNFLFVASSGPGETNKTGLIVPQFGNKPENHVSVSMTYEGFSGMMLTTKAHYEAWLSVWYAKQATVKKENPPKLERIPAQPKESAPEPVYDLEPGYGAVAMF